MQDKNYIADIDEQFTNLAWENMRGVLDAEIPVVPARKRRWGWLWLLILLPSFFVFGIMIYFGIAVWQDEKNDDNIEEINQVIAANVIENTNDATTFEENNEATSEVIIENGKQHSNDNIQAKEKAIIYPKNTTQKEIIKNINENNLHIIKENNFNRKNIDENVFFVENKVENSSVYPRTDDFSRRKESSHLTTEVVSTNISEKEPTKNVAPIIVPIENSTRNSLGSTERVATLFPEKISPNQLKINKLIPSDPIPKPRKFSQTYSVMIGVRSDEFTNFGGANAGLLAHYSFSPKLGLETGLTYNNIRKKINTNVDYTDSITLQYPDNTQQFNRTLTDALNLHYLRLPLSFTYRPHTKIQLAAGLNVGYRFTNNKNNNSSDNSTVFTSSDSDILNIGDTYSSSFQVNAEIIEDVAVAMNPGQGIDVAYSFTVRKWDLAAHAGLRYNPISRLGIDFSYQYGLLKMTPNSSTNRNSGLQLALVYQLHR